MKKIIFTVFTIFLLIISCVNSVSAENATENLLSPTDSLKENNLRVEEETSSRNSEEVKAREDGHFNITFDDGYNGYCANYGDEEAEVDDVFIVQDTSRITNSLTGESVGNYLKVFFVDYYDVAMKDKIVTQHMIWHFTDNFNGWRLDYDLIEEIKNVASTKFIPDHGATKKINDTSELKFDFEMLESPNSEHQNFFAYKITLRDIITPELENKSNETLVMPQTNDSSKNYPLNQSENVENISGPSDDVLIQNSSNNDNSTSLNVESKTNLPNSKETVDSPNEQIKLSKYATGYERNIGIAMFLILLGIVVVKYFKRD